MANPTGRPPKPKATRTNLYLSPIAKVFFKALGGGGQRDMTKGAERCLRMAQLLQKAYGHCPEELQQEIEKLGVVKAVKAAKAVPHKDGNYYL